MNDEQSLSDYSLADGAGGIETGLAGVNDREIGPESGGRAIGVEGGNMDGILMDNSGSSILPSEARDVQGEGCREVSNRMGEPCGESIQASSSSRAALITGRKECRVTSFSRGATLRNPAWFKSANTGSQENKGSDRYYYTQFVL